MNRSDSKYFSASTIIHIALSLLVLSVAINKEAPPPPPIEIEIAQPTQGGTPDIIPKEVEGNRPCELWYGGIGIIGDVIVQEVYEGYPAYRAGIRVGDELLPSESIRGEPGTKLELDVIRNNIKLRFTLIREKICYD